MPGHTIEVECPSCTSSLSVIRDEENPFFVCSRCSHVFEFVENSKPLVLQQNVSVPRRQEGWSEPIAFVDNEPTPNRRRWIFAAAGLAIVLLSGYLLLESNLSLEAPTSVLDNTIVEEEFETISLKIDDPHELTSLLNIYEMRTWQIKSVDMSGTECTDDDIELLFHFENLEKLNLNDTQITNRGVERICLLGDQLKELQLRGTKITDSALLHVGNLDQLESLDVSRTAISNLTMTRLQTLRNLRSLYLGQTDVTDEGMFYLEKLSNLNVLSVRQTTISDEGIVHLVDLPSLFLVNLNETQVTDECLDLLVDAPSLQNIYLRETAVTQAAIERIESVSPKRVLH